MPGARAMQSPMTFARIRLLELRGYARGGSSLPLWGGGSNVVPIEVGSWCPPERRRCKRNTLIRWRASPRRGVPASGGAGAESNKRGISSHPRIGLAAFAVDLGDGERAGGDVVEAAHVHECHLRAVRPRASPKRFDAARLAEEVMPDVLVELVIGECFLTLQEFGVLGGHEREQKSFREQCEQLHSTTRPRSVVTSKCTLPQWQRPRYVFRSLMIRTCRSG